METGQISKVTIDPSGQVKLTVPRAIARSMRMRKGAEVEWVFDKGDLIIRVL